MTKQEWLELFLIKCQNYTMRSGRRVSACFMVPEGDDFDDYIQAVREVSQLGFEYESVHGHLTDARRFSWKD